MFSLDKFYIVLHNNLIQPVNHNSRSVYFFPFGTYDTQAVLADSVDTQIDDTGRSWGEKGFFHCYFFDQEPFYDFTKLIVEKSRLSFKHVVRPNRYKILTVSEYSEIVNTYSTSEDYHVWYYFFHGFAALDWYRDFQYIEPQSFNRFDKVFICYNHLSSKLRSYRLHLVSNMIQQNLIQHGHVSLFLKDNQGGWKETITDPENPLDNRARVKIYHTLKDIKESLIIDTDTPNGSMSANVSFDQLTSALWHIVTETVYFDPKLHLTEKIFKPIVAKRPFILVAAPGNLAYLKSYGFKTFDRWIDESYDLEQDHYIRIEKITAELARLCAMDPSTLGQMHVEMQGILEYNFNHFYTTFKDLIIDELVDNFENLLHLTSNYNKQLSNEYLLEVKKRLKQ